jgi:virulence-associated protein VagC
MSVLLLRSNQSLSSVRETPNGRNRAVRIPAEFELPGDEATTHRNGDRLVVQPVRKPGLVALLKSMEDTQITPIPARMIAILTLIQNHVGTAPAGRSMITNQS